MSGGKPGHEREATTMTKLYLNGKKASKKAVEEKVGAERLKKMIESAKETHREDPLIQHDFFLGGLNGMLTIEFEI